MKRKVTIIKYKKENEMKKITALIFALILTLGLVGCNGKTGSRYFQPHGSHQHTRSDFVTITDTHRVAVWQERELYG